MPLNYSHLLICALVVIIYGISIEARSRREEHASGVDDQQLEIILSNYRHRFERSINFKKLRWASSDVSGRALCDACDLLVPEVMET